MREEEGLASGQRECLAMTGRRGLATETRRIPRTDEDKRPSQDGKEKAAQ